MGKKGDGFFSSSSLMMAGDKSTIHMKGEREKINRIDFNESKFCMCCVCNYVAQTQLKSCNTSHTKNPLSKLSICYKSFFFSTQKIVAVIKNW